MSKMGFPSAITPAGQWFHNEKMWLFGRFGSSLVFGHGSLTRRPEWAQNGKHFVFMYITKSRISPVMEVMISYLLLEIQKIGAVDHWNHVRDQCMLRFCCNFLPNFQAPFLFLNNLRSKIVKKNKVL